MRILFIRHGDPDYINDTLTKKGHREAKLLAERAADLNLGSCYVSPLGRAKDTAQYCLDKVGKTAQTVEWLRACELSVTSFLEGLRGRCDSTKAWKGTRSGRNNIDRLVALTTSVAFLFSVFNTFFPDYWLGIGLEPHVYYGVAAVIIAFSLTGEFMEERARRNVSAAICRLGGWQHNAARVLPEKQRIDDRVAELFVPVILIISLLTFFIWVFFGGIDVVSHGLFAALSVLVVACPCAVGLATPVALAAGLNKAARNHILIRDTSALEQMRNVDVVVFDKTGTLTEGHPTVIGWLWAQGQEEHYKDVLLAAESTSDHPLAEITEGTVCIL